MRKILIIIVMVALTFGCSSVKFKLADGTTYERRGRQELSDIEIYLEKEDGTIIRATMGKQKSDPEQIQDILKSNADGIAKIIEALQQGKIQ